MNLKKAFGAIEILFVVIIIVIIYFACFNNQNGRSNPFEEANKQVKTRQTVVEDKLNNIQESKTLMNEQIKKNLDGEY